MNEILKIKKILNRTNLDSSQKNLFDQVEDFDSYLHNMGVKITKKQLIESPSDIIPSFNWIENKIKQK